MPNLNAPAAGADTGDARAEGYSSVSDAVAELDRRDRERNAARKAKQADSAGDRDAVETKPRRAQAPRTSASDDADSADDDRRQIEGEDDEEEDTKPKRKADKTAADDEDDDQADDASDGEDEDEDEDAGSDDNDSGDDEENPGEDDDAEPKKRAAEKQPAKVRINIAGRDIEATPDEVSSYLNEAATERQQMSQARQHLGQQAQMLQQQGQALATLAQALIGQEPAIELAQSDPGAYIAHQAQHRQRMALLQQLYEHTNQASQIAQANQQQASVQFVERERGALLKAMPELADPTKLASFNGRVSKVAQQYGYSAQELAGAFDHRIFLMFRDLGRLADMDADRAKVREKLRKAPVLKTPEARSGQGQRTKSSADARSKDALRTFLKSGRTMRDVKAYLARTER